MRLFFIGDIVGTPGLQIVRTLLPEFRLREEIDLVVANAENTTNGSGLNPTHYRQVRDSGVDVVTMGDHIYKKSELIRLMNAGEPICKPINYPSEAPGHETVTGTTASGIAYKIVSVMGRTYMRSVDCPFRALDRVLGTQPPTCITFVDMHAEATADKYLIGRFLDGRVSAVLGTHTHVTTADEQILPKGTAFQCDVGMTGSHGGVLGRRFDRVMPTWIDFVPRTYEIDDSDVRLCGTIVDLDETTYLARNICRVSLKAGNSA